jgi:class 3 adenylate cyclase
MIYCFFALIFACFFLITVFILSYRRQKKAEHETQLLYSQLSAVSKSSSAKIQVFARLGNILSSSFDRNLLLPQILSELSSFFPEFKLRIVIKEDIHKVHLIGFNQNHETIKELSFPSLAAASKETLRSKSDIWSSLLDDEAMLNYVYSFPLLTDEQIRGFLLVCKDEALESGDYHFFTDIGSIISSVLQNILTEREKDFISEEFGRSVDPRVRDYLLSAKEEGKILCVSVLFFDIRNFTTMSENLGPVTTVALLNEVFSLCDDIIRAEGGFINKFTGDGFMAVFGAPLSTPNHEKEAVRSALKILENVSIDCGIGIASGEAVAGTIGSSKRKEYTVIGDTVNTASRIEGLCKVFGSALLVSESTMKGAEDCIKRSRSLGRIKVKGKTEALEVYDLQSRGGCYTDDFKKSVDLYYSGDFNAAKASFVKLKDAYPEDKACSWFYDRSIERVQCGEPWDGSERMSEK